MAKAKTTPAVVEQPQQIILTQEQFEALQKIRTTIDEVSDSLDDINGDSNRFEIGKVIGDVISNIIRAYQELDIIIEAIDPEASTIHFWSEEDEN